MRGNKPRVFSDKVRNKNSKYEKENIALIWRNSDKRIRGKKIIFAQAVKTKTR